MGYLRNIGLVFFSPSQVGRNVSERPNWVIPIVTVLIVMFVASFATYTYQVEYQKQAMQRLQRDRGVDIDIDSYLKPTLTKHVFSGVAGALWALVMIVIGSSALLGLSAITGGTGGFRRLLCFFGYVWVIGAAGNLAKVPLVLAKKSIDVRTSLGAFAPGVRFDSPTGLLLNSADIFSIWMVVATVMGFKVITGLSARKSVAIVVGLYALYVALKVIGALVSSRIMG